MTNDSIVCSTAAAFSECKKNLIKSPLHDLKPSVYSRLPLNGNQLFNGVKKK
jgi:hypothetical protein